MGRRTAALVAVALLAAVLLWLRRGPGVPPEPPPAPVAEPVEARGQSASHPAAQASPSASVRAAARPPTRSERAQRFSEQMAQERQVLLTKFRYPPESSPLAHKTDLLLPHQVEPVMRGLSFDGDGKLRVEQNQSRVYLRPGQTAVASFKILYEGKPTSVDIRGSNLVREAGGTTPATTVAPVTFHDDGVAPDALAGDGEFTAAITTPSGNPRSGMNLFVDLASNGETGRLAYPFIQTGPQPATFTQTARSALEDGSIVFYVGITVLQPGPFEILGRVYDSSGAPAVFCRFHDALSADAKEVRLVAYGAVLLDQGAAAPLTLRDLEGWRFALGQYPDRDVMDEWDANVASVPFDVKQLSNKDWAGAEAQQRLAAFDQSTADGLASIQSQPGP